MTTNADTLQALLATMRKQFLQELPERCDRFSMLILELEKKPDQETFNDLYRNVHSLKGTGGTHGLNIITTICHQLETYLTECNTQQKFGEVFANRALAYVDLLRRIEPLSQAKNPDYSEIETELEILRQSTLQNRKTGLIAESSQSMATLYQQALKQFPLQLTIESNGITALERLLHQPYDIVIVGGEIKQLNGMALMAALRASQTRNQNIPSLLITSNRKTVPEHLKFNVILNRDQKLADNLTHAVQTTLFKPPS